MRTRRKTAQRQLHTTQGLLLRARAPVDGCGVPRQNAVPGLERSIYMDEVVLEGVIKGDAQHVHDSGSPPGPCRPSLVGSFCRNSSLHVTVHPLKLLAPVQ
jgi:hypothetical protein